MSEFLAGQTVQYRGDGRVMVVISPATLRLRAGSRGWLCSWMSDNRRYQDEFDECELMPYDSPGSVTPSRP